MTYPELLDWRRRMAEVYLSLRQRPSNAETIGWFRAQKDSLFRHHPESPIRPDQRAGFAGLSYWPLDPSARVVAQFVPDRAEVPAPLPHSGQVCEPEMSFSRVGTLVFRLWEHPCELGAFWIQGYAGGLFVPFRDETSGHETYAAGRYLLDTIKGADLGGSIQMDGTSNSTGDSVVLDFNYAYHPSCAYDPRWVCPLSPAENRLPFPVRVGERNT